MRRKLFSLNRSNRELKNPSLYWLQKFSFDLSTKYRTHKKGLPKKSISQLANQFLAKSFFFWVHFSTSIKLYVWNQYEKTYFWIPHSPYLKEEGFHLLQGTMNSTSRTCRSLIFIGLSKFYATHRDYEFFAKHWSLIQSVTWIVVSLYF